MVFIDQKLEKGLPHLCLLTHVWGHLMFPERPLVLDTPLCPLFVSPGVLCTWRSWGRSPSWLVSAVSLFCIIFTCMETTWEKMASGTARSTDSSQMETAFRHVQKTALDVWMSIGFTMALYLRAAKGFINNQTKDENRWDKSESMEPGFVWFQLPKSSLDISSFFCLEAETTNGCGESLIEQLETSGCVNCLSPPVTVTVEAAVVIVGKH